MNRILFLAIAAALLAAAQVEADIMTWQAPQYLAGDGDVVTQGTLDRAYCFAALSDQTVNGVTFLRVNVPFGSSPFTVGNTGFGVTGTDTALTVFSYSDPATPWANLSTSYKDMLNGTLYDNGPTQTTLGLTLSGLTPGREYLFQSWVSANGYGPISYSGRTQTIKATGDAASSNTLYWSSTPGTAGGVGQYVIGTFTAASTSQQIDFLGTEVAQINAFQLRIMPVPEPGTLTLLIGGLFGLLAYAWRNLPAQ